MVPVGVSRSGPATGRPRTVSGLVRRSAVIAVLLLVGMLGALLAGCNSGHLSAPAPAAHQAAAPLPPPVAVITSDPANQAANISPLATITVTVARGKLGEVSVASPQGTPVAGQLQPDSTTWKTTEPLGYGKTYTINATAVGDDNRQVRSTSTFTTIAPRTLAFPSINPLNGETVGVGQPISIYFDEPITDKQAAENTITVTTDPPVEGAFYLVLAARSCIGVRSSSGIREPTLPLISTTTAKTSATECTASRTGRRTSRSVMRSSLRPTALPTR